ncbi:adenylate/guanylate cyclase domain-containing protein [Paenarthrobacter sp. NPDC090517]|uniref:adenylate/guanylate cyclase domain-containing protein n=1 Tax=Paenarthrobacter sp. NPDC090517 TaxID=3364381 RepID=UPI00380E9A60
MDGNYKFYSYTSSAARIDEILNQPTGQFEEKDNFPDRDKLTYTNGVYGKCTAIFVDIRDSSGLTEKHKRPALAKIYRSFISEMVAVLNSSRLVREVNIVGDCVWAVYSTPLQSDIDDLFTLVCTANTLKKLLNAKLIKKELTPLKLGIGVDYGRALMIKAGYSGSGINDVIYMGDVVNRAAHLANKAGRRYRDSIWVGSWFAENLNEHNTKILSSSYETGLSKVYKCDAVVSPMDEWIDENFS